MHGRNQRRQRGRQRPGRVRGVKFGPVPLAEAAGKILGHNIAGTDGQRLLRKGRPLTAADVAALAGIGRQTVYVAELEPGDVDENNAARRVARALSGPGLLTFFPLANTSPCVGFTIPLMVLISVDLPQPE